MERQQFATVRLTHHPAGWWIVPLFQEYAAMLVISSRPLCVALRKALRYNLPFTYF